MKRGFFDGFVFVVSSDVPEDVRSLICICGGVVSGLMKASTTHGLVVGRSQEDLPCAAELRGLRLPILRTSWVRACVAASRLLPMKGSHVVYDPYLFEGLRFTTTLLPRNLKEQFAALIVFLGGSYSPQLTTWTDVVLVGVRSFKQKEKDDPTAADGVRRRDLSMPAGCSAKWEEALKRSVPCVDVEWFETCITTGRLQPLSFCS
uniref:BRCT domain-containing protein n=1 Tax=Trypanosoma congolense (strain IL3000) TaxID=1068625 RepID=G0UWQ1_TRYCI|nr:conserved hypothetical protein [Trypanosoma congolense IL3000]